MCDMWHLNHVLHFRSTQLHSHSILKYKTTINTTQDNLEASAKNVTPQPTNISHLNFNYQLKNIQPNPRPKTHCIVWLQLKHKPAGLLLTLNQDDHSSFHPQSIKACNVPPCHILIHEDNLFDVISCILRSLCIDIWFWYSIFRFYPEARSISSCKVAAVIRLWHIWLATSDSGVQRR